ncbi:MAG: DNA/RNA non-specific endonuclease [Zavarzinella sp.]
MRIADHHTYFVGSDEWGFSAWAHNAGSEYFDLNEITDFAGGNRGAREQAYEAADPSLFDPRVFDEANRPIKLSESELIALRSQIVAGEETVFTPHTKYMTPDGSVHMTDGTGRLVKTSFKVDEHSLNPPNSRVARSSHTEPFGESLSGVPGDIGFHLRADTLQGSPFYTNLVPGNTKLNNGAFKSLETKWKSAANVDIRLMSR